MTFPSFLENYISVVNLVHVSINIGIFKYQFLLLGLWMPNIFLTSSLICLCIFIFLDFPLFQISYILLSITKYMAISCVAKIKMLQPIAREHERKKGNEIVKKNGIFNSIILKYSYNFTMWHGVYVWGVKSVTRNAFARFFIIGENNIK